MLSCPPGPDEPPGVPCRPFLLPAPPSPSPSPFPPLLPLPPSCFATCTENVKTCILEKSIKTNTFTTFSPPRSPLPLLLERSITHFSQLFSLFVAPRGVRRDIPGDLPRELLAAAGCSWLLAAAGGCWRLLAAAGCCRLLLAAADCWLLPAAAACRRLLPAAAGCSWLLAAAGCCRLPLATASCWLLPAAAGCRWLLPAAAGCCRLLPGPGCPWLLPRRFPRPP